MDFEKFFDSHMKNYIGKLKMMKWNRFEIGCKNESISFTSPLWQLCLHTVKVIKSNKEYKTDVEKSLLEYVYIHGQSEG